MGPGRAGRSLAGALGAVGWSTRLFGRHDPTDEIGRSADVVVIATGDAEIESVAAALPPTDAVVLHLAGSLGLDVLPSGVRRAALHPLVALPDPEIGAARLPGSWFAVAGDAMAETIVRALGGRSFTVADDDRARYHAAAVVASNHLVAVLGQAERIAASAGVPFEALLDLVEGTIANVSALGPAAALTGPAARGDEATIRRHIDALAPDERPTYIALADEARRLAGHEHPDH